MMLRRLYRHPLGWFILPFLATVMWTLLWAWYDIALVGVAFRCADCSFPNEWAYWIATWYVLFPVATLLAFRRWAWLPILATWLGGWEDIFFYWIQGSSVPHDTSYLFLTPTDTVLYARAIAFLAGSLVCLVWYRLRRG
jgi:hypothetical protein